MRMFRTKKSCTTSSTSSRYIGYWMRSSSRSKLQQAIGQIGQTKRDGVHSLCAEHVLKRPSSSQSSTIPQKLFHVTVAKRRGILAPDNLVEVRVAPLPRRLRFVRRRGGHRREFRSGRN
jgi:hypothetical protein